MGERGPQKQPSAIQAKRGNPGKRTAANEPKPDMAAEKPPACLRGDKEATRKWKEMVIVLRKNGLFTELDPDMLTVYCLAWSEFVRLDKDLRDGDLVVESDKGGMYQDPRVSIRNKAIDRMYKVGRQFGLSPSSRAGLNVEGRKEVSNLERLMKRAQNAEG